ncbi:MAG: hypothetical protein SVJ22_07980, partial [Halobacteriota archaeon]|nr:hypothetical protein [Halobacteriota archaeon]
YNITSGTETQITTNMSTQHLAVIYGDRIVWQDERNGYGNVDIYMYNLSIGTEMQITTDTADQGCPAIYGDKIVYNDYRNGNSDIYMYNIISGTETQISTSILDEGWPDIYGDIIVWHSWNGDSNIYMYDLTSGTKTQITTNTSKQSNPEIYADIIVWQDNRSGNWDIYMYNITSGTETQITTNSSDQKRPDIYGDRIVWQHYRNGNVDIYMYDLSSGNEIQITVNDSKQFDPRIYGDRIVWDGWRNGNGDVYMYDFNLVAQWLKNSTIPKLESAKTDNRRVDREIGQTITLIESSLKDRLWEDETHLDPRIGDRVFNRERQAVENMQKNSLKPWMPDEVKAVFKEVIDDLVSADEMLALTVIEEAKAYEGTSHAVDRQICLAEKNLEEAYEELDDPMDQDNAIFRFGRAWEHAQRTIAIAEGS